MPLFLRWYYYKVK